MENIEPVIQYIEDLTGITLNNHILSNIQKFVQQKLKQYSTIQNYLKHLAQSDLEYNEMIENTTIHETYFFRESKHFDCASQLLLKLKNSSEKINIWSVTCATGEEPLSMAMLCENLKLDYQCYATDISIESINRFKDGNYTRNSIRSDGKEYHFLLKKYGYFDHEQWVCQRELLDKIRIQKLNLYKDEMDTIPGEMDLLFFRNTLLYMSQENKKFVIDRLVNKMKPGGYLFLGSTEVPFIRNSELTIIDNDHTYYFRKKKQKKLNELTELKIITIQEQDQEKSFVVKSIDPDQLYHLLNQQGDLKPSENQNYKVAQIIKNIISELNQQKTEQATLLLNDLSIYKECFALYYYFMGRLKVSEQYDWEAVDYFEEVIEKEPQFWPAQFYLAQVLMNQDIKKSYMHFKICKSKILKDLDDQYQFLLEDFNKEYYQHICEQKIKQIETLRL